MAVSGLRDPDSKTGKLRTETMTNEATAVIATRQVGDGLCIVAFLVRKC